MFTTWFIENMGNKIMTLKGLPTMLEVDLLSESRPDWSETGNFSSTDIHRRSLRSSLVFHRLVHRFRRSGSVIGRTKPVSLHRSAVFPRLQVAPRLRAGLPRGVEQHGSLGDSTPTIRAQTSRIKNLRPAKATEQDSMS